MRVEAELDGLRGQAIGAPALHPWLERVRFRHWAHFLVLPLATFDPLQLSATAALALGRGVVNAFAILAFGYLLNSLSDRRMDLDSRKNSFISSGTGARGSLIALGGLSIAMAVLSPWPAQLATATCLAFGCIYSVGPRLKSLPIIGSATNLANFGPLLFLGMQHDTLPPGFAYLAWVFAMLLLQNQLIHEAADRIEDHGGGLQTTWIALGPRRSAVLAAALGAGAAGAAACLGSPPIAAVLALVCAAVFALGFPLRLARCGSDARQASDLRLTHRWCALLIGVALFAAWHWDRIAARG